MSRAGRAERAWAPVAATAALGGAVALLVLLPLGGPSTALAQVVSPADGGASAAPVLQAPPPLPQAVPSLAAFTVVGDAIPMPLADAPGDPARGRAIVASRQTGLCLLCHSGPFPEERFQGTLAPSLAGAGSRYDAGQLRLRIADGKRLNPASVMPSYARTSGLQRVGTAWRGKPVLSVQQIEDVVAFLATLQE